MKPDCTEAFYFQGLARFQLGYAESAIEAYTQAIALASDEAKAFYQRGVAQAELENFSQAIADLEQAVHFFKLQGNEKYFYLANEQLQRLQGKRSFSDQASVPQQKIVEQLRQLLVEGFRAWVAFSVNPMGALLPAFARLERWQAIAIGCLYAAIAAAYSAEHHQPVCQTRPRS